MPRRRVLLISSAPIGPRMAGPAIRYVRMAGVLRETHDVRLAAPNGGGRVRIGDVAVEPYRHIAALARASDVVISQGVGPYLADLADCRAVRVFDLYDPIHIEAAAYFAHETGGLVEPIMQLQLQAVMRWGDYFLCTGPRQRDMWLGLLSAERHVLGDWVRTTAPLERWIEAPFGIDDEPPRTAGATLLRGRLPGVDDRCFVLLWNGGIWNWLDPLTPIRAVAALAERQADVRLVFLGGAAADLHLPRMKMVRAARDEAARLHVLERQVHFVPHWIDFDARGAWLLESDTVLSAGPAGLEHHFAYRTRLLDAVWAGRAAIANPGEAVAERMAEAGAVRLVAPGDVGGLAGVIERMMSDRGDAEAMGRRAAALRPEWTWRRVLRGLVRVCGDGNPCRERGGGERRWYEWEHFKLKQRDRAGVWARRLQRIGRIGGGDGRRS